jgi:hypothetical protein
MSNLSLKENEIEDTFPRDLMKKLNGRFFESNTKLEEIVTSFCQDKDKIKNLDAFYL